MAQAKVYQNLVGKTTRVLFETEKDGVTDGLTDNYIRVYTESPVVCGEIYEVAIEKLYKDGVLDNIKDDLMLYTAREARYYVG